MKPTKSNRFSIILTATGLLVGGNLFAQTVEIDPAGAIPGTHAQVFASEWNTDGDVESWTTNQFNLEPGTPLSGMITGTASGTDPQLNRSGINLPTSADTIIEFSVRKEAADTTRMDLFWGDDNGGISGARVIPINVPPFVADDAFHVIRISFSGQILGNINQFRFDTSSDALGNGKTVSVDYFRVYSVLPPASLAWDPGVTGTGTAGGSGNWNTSSNLWWNGSAQVAWPATSSLADEATFAGTAGTVTIDDAGVTAAKINFNTAGYTVTGGALSLDGAALLRSPAGTTTLDVPLDGSGPIIASGSTFIIKQAGTQTNSTRFNNQNTAASVDNAFGTGSVILGNNSNFFISSLGSTRTHTNNFEWRGNRLIIDSNDHGTGLSAFNLVMDGNLLLAGTAPSDIFLRRNLTVNGVVSGNGPAGRSLFFVGDANTMTLNNPANDFTGTLRWENGTTLAVVADGSLGNAANTLSFNAGTGGVKLLDAFDSARPIAVAGATAARIDTNGFDSEWSGGVTGANGVNSRLLKQGVGILTLKGTNFLGGGTQVQGGTLELPAGASLTHSTTWDNLHGVNENGIFLLSGGTMLVNNSFYAVGRGAGSGEGLFQIDSGTYTHNGGAVLVGFAGNGRFVMNGGTAVINQLNYGDGTSSRIAIAELNGGSLTMDQAGRRGGDADATIKLNGTTIVGKSNKTDFLPVGSAGTTSFLVGTGGALFNTAGFKLGIVNPLQHDTALGATLDGGLTKSGPGTLTLDAANTFTGPTTVAAGFLGGNGSVASGVTVSDGAGLSFRVTNPALGPGTGYSDLDIAGALVVPASLVIKIDSSGTVFPESPVTGLTVATASGGITGFAAATFDLTDFTGTGTWSAYVDVAGNSLKLDYSLVATSPYDTWLAAYPSITGANRAPDVDFDNDGIDNGVEFLTGSAPDNSADAKPPAVTLDGSGDLVVTFKRQDAAEAYTVSVESSTTLLGPWTPIVVPNDAVAGPPVTVVDNGTAPDDVTVVVASGGSPRKFARVKIEIPFTP